MVVSITEACASCLSGANGSRRGSTRCTLAAFTPLMVRMLRAISPSIARVSLIFCWNWLAVIPSPRSSSSYPIDPPDGSPSRASVTRSRATWSAGTKICVPPAPSWCAIFCRSSTSIICPASRASNSEYNSAMRSDPPRIASIPNKPSSPTATTPMATSRAAPKAFRPSNSAFIGIAGKL